MTRSEFVIKHYKNYKKVNWLQILSLLFLTLLYAYLLSDPISEILGSENHKTTFHQLEITGLLSAILIAPIFEEFVLRGFLSMKKNVSFHFTLFLLMLSTFFFALNQQLIAILFLFFIAFYFFLLGISKNNQRFLIRFFRFRFSFFFWISTFSFVMIHYPNLESDLSILSKIILLIIVFTPISIVLGYTRIRYGLRFSILLHSISNLATIVINTYLYG